MQVFAGQHLCALAIDDFALMVHDVVVLKHIFTRLEVAAFDLALGVFNGTRQHPLVNGLVVGHAQGFHQAVDALRAEQAHEVVFKRQVKRAFAGVALAAGAAAQLVVNAAGFVPLCTEDIKAPGLAHELGVLFGLGAVFFQLFGKLCPCVEHLGVLRFGITGRLAQKLFAHARFGKVVARHILRVTAQHDVGAAACHVGGNGDGVRLAGLGDNMGFFFMMLGVEHLVLDAFAAQHVGQNFAFFNGNGADQHGLSLFVALLDGADDGAELAGFVFEHRVGVVDANERFVGRNLNDVELIDVAELFFLGQGGARHARQLIIQPEVVLESDGGQRLAFAQNTHALFGFDGLVQTLVVAAAEHQAAGELVDNDNLAVAHHVVDVFFHDSAGLDGLIDMVHQGHVFRVGHVFNLEIRLGLAHAARRDGGRLGLFVNNIVGVNVILAFFGVDLNDFERRQGGGKTVGNSVQLGRFVALARNDERRARLVDQNGVDFVDNGKVVSALDHFFLVNGHVVAQVVKAHFVVGAIGDVAGISVAALGVGHAVYNHADRQTEKTVDFAHPVAVALGQVVVDRDQMHALAFKRVEIKRQGGDQRFAFAGLHFGDTTLVQHDAADELHAVREHAEHTARGFTAHGKCVGQNVVQRFAGVEPGFERRCLCAQLFVGHGGVFALALLNGSDEGHQFFNLFLRGVAKEFFEESGHILSKLPFG